MSNSTTNKARKARLSDLKMQFSDFEYSPPRFTRSPADLAHQLDQLIKEDVRAPYSPPADAVPPKMDADGNIIFEVNGREFHMRMAGFSREELLKTIPTRGLLFKRRK